MTNEMITALLTKLVLKMESENSRVLAMLENSGRSNDLVASGVLRSPDKTVNQLVSPPDNESNTKSKQDRDITTDDPIWLYNDAERLMDEFNARHPHVNCCCCVNYSDEEPKYAIRDVGHPENPRLTEWFSTVAEAWAAAENTFPKTEAEAESEQEEMGRWQIGFNNNHPDLDWRCYKRTVGLLHQYAIRDHSKGGWPEVTDWQSSIEAAWAQAKQRIENGCDETCTNGNVVVCDVPVDDIDSPYDPNEKYECVTDRNGNHWIQKGHVNPVAVTCKKDSSALAWQTFRDMWNGSIGNLDYFPFEKSAEEGLPRAFAADCGDRWWILNTTEDGGFFQIVAEGRTRADAWLNAIRLSQPPVLDDEDKQLFTSASKKYEAKLKRINPQVGLVQVGSYCWIYDPEREEIISGISSDPDSAWVSAGHLSEYEKNCRDSGDAFEAIQFVKTIWPQAEFVPVIGGYAVCTEKESDHKLSWIAPPDSESRDKAWINAAERLKANGITEEVSDDPFSVVMARYPDARCELMDTGYSGYKIVIGSDSPVSDLKRSPREAWISAAEGIKNSIEYQEQNRLNGYIETVRKEYPKAIHAKIGRKYMIFDDPSSNDCIVISDECDSIIQAWESAVVQILQKRQEDEEAQVAQWKEANDCETEESYASIRNKVIRVYPNAICSYIENAEKYGIFLFDESERCVSELCSTDKEARKSALKRIESEKYLKDSDAVRKVYPKAECTHLPKIKKFIIHDGESHDPHGGFSGSAEACQKLLSDQCNTVGEAWANAAQRIENDRSEAYETEVRKLFPNAACSGPSKNGRYAIRDLYEPCWDREELTNSPNLISGWCESVELAWKNALKRIQQTQSESDEDAVKKVFPNATCNFELIGSSTIYEIMDGDKALSNTFTNPADAWKSALEMIRSGARPSHRERKPKVSESVFHAVSREDRIKQAIENAKLIVPHLSDVLITRLIGDKSDMKQVHVSGISSKPCETKDDAWLNIADQLEAAVMEKQQNEAKTATN